MSKSKETEVKEEESKVTGETTESQEETKEEVKLPKEKMISRSFNTHTIEASKIVVNEKGEPSFEVLENLVVEQEQMNETKALLELTKLHGAGSYFIKTINTTTKTYEMSVSKFLENATEVVKEDK